jgi:AraC-like DNA-binding protein
MPHQPVGVEGGSEMGWITIPISEFLQWHLGDRLTRRLLSGEILIDAEDGLLDAQQLSRWAQDCRDPEAGMELLVALEVCARLGRLALRLPKSAPAASEAGQAHADAGVHQVETMAAYLGARFREDLSAADVAASVGLHPNYAMQVFRRTCGMTILQYLTHLRLLLAQRLLLTSRQTVLTVALEWGFGSLARFYAAFRSQCGVSPGRFRARGQPA